MDDIHSLLFMHTDTETQRRRLVQGLVMILILAAGYALRLHELTRQDIWWDEARNIDVALRPLHRIAGAPELDIHPPVYFWLLHLTARSAGAEVGMPPVGLAFLMRYLSVSAGVLGIALVFQLAQRAVRTGNARRSVSSAGVIAAAVAAASPFWLAESQEARMYTVGFALLTGAAVAFLQLLTTPPDRESRRLRRYRYHIAFVLLSALALMTHYNVVFVLVAWYLWWFVWAVGRPNRRRHLAILCGCGLAMTLLVLPIAPIALRQIPGYANPNLTVPSVLEYLSLNWQAYLGGYGYSPALMGGQAGLWLVTVLVLTGLGLVLRRGSGQVLSFLLTWLAGGLVLYYVAVVDRGAFNVRYSSFVTPALYALVGLASAGFGRMRRPLVWVLPGLVLLGAVPALAADYYGEQAAREEIGAVTDWLRSNAGPGDVVFVDQKYPFGFYYDRYAIDADAVPTGQEAAPARYLFVDINTIEDRLNQWAGQADRVFWVQWFESDTDPRRSVPFLLDKAGTRAGEKNFPGYSIDWWTLDPPTEFEMAAEFRPLALRFEPGIRVDELALPDAPLAAGETLFVVLRWAPDGPASNRPLKARLALYAPDGSRVVQSDERILNDRHLMPGEWSDGDRPLNVYKLATPADLPAGRYGVRILVYDADTLEPFGFLDAAGNPAGVEPELGVVAVAEPVGNE